MSDCAREMLRALGNSELIAGYCDDLSVAGEDPWELTIELEWKDVGKLRISPLALADFWALREWWNHSLSHRSKYMFFLFPEDERKDRYIANHIKDNEARRSLVFNAWLVADDAAARFDSEIIGNFFVLDCLCDKPIVGIAVADKFHHKKLGLLFMSVLIRATKMLGKKELWLTTSVENKTGHGLYQRVGFQDVGKKEVHVTTESYKRMEYEMKLDLESIE